MSEIRHFYPPLTIITDNMGMEAGDNLIEVQRDDIKNTERDFDPAVYTAARIFNAVALPDDMPDFLKEAIEAKAEQAKISAQEAGFVAPDMGNLIDGKTIQEREREKDDENRAYVASIAQDIEERRQHEREEASYQEWRQERHSYAGQTMNGENWHRLMTWFREPENVAAWEDAMMAETGQTREEVRQTGGKMKRFYDLMEKDGRGTMTSAERAEFDTLNNDADVKRGVEVQQELQAHRADRGLEQSAESAQRIDDTQQQRLAARQDFNDDITASQGRLASVNPISSTYTELALGKAPPMSAAPQPSATVAANTKTVNPDNMFG